MNRTYRTGSDARTGEERPLKPWGTQPETGLDNNNNDRGQFGQRKKSHGRVLAAQVVAADDRSNNQPHTVWYGNITGIGPANNAPQAVRLWLGRIGVEIRSWSASLLLLLLSLSLLSISSLHPLSIIYQSGLLAELFAYTRCSVSWPVLFCPPLSPPVLHSQLPSVISTALIHTVQPLLCGCFFSLALSALQRF